MPVPPTSLVCSACFFSSFQLLLCTGGIFLGWPAASFLRTRAVALFQADSSCFERSASGPQRSTVATVHGDTSHQVRGKDTFKCTPTLYYFQGSKHCRIWMRFPQVSLDIRILEKRSFLQGGLVILLMKVHFDGLNNTTMCQELALGLIIHIFMCTHVGRYI